MIRFKFLRYVTVCFAISVASLSSHSFARDISFILSNDSRGVSQYIQDQFFVFNGSSNQDDGTSLGTTEARESSDPRLLSVVPTHSVFLKLPLVMSERSILGLKFRLNRTQSSLSYPNGLTLSSSPEIKFTEPVSLNLSSFDAGFGPYTQFQFSSQLTLEFSALAVKQRIYLDSKLGDWHLKDTFDRDFFEIIVTLEYAPFFNRSELAPRIYSSVQLCEGELNALAGLRIIIFKIE